MALDGNEWLTPRSGRFTDGKDPVPIVEEAGWAPGMEDVAPTGIRSPDRPSTLTLLPNLSCSPNVIRVSTSRRMRLAGHVACVGVEGEEVDTRFW
jgi:hypothetical protein